MGKIVLQIFLRVACIHTTAVIIVRSLYEAIVLIQHFRSEYVESQFGKDHCECSHLYHRVLHVRVYGSK